MRTTARAAVWVWVGREAEMMESVTCRAACENTRVACVEARSRLWRELRSGKKQSTLRRSSAGSCSRAEMSLVFGVSMGGTILVATRLAVLPLVVGPKEVEQ
jgi:hypothetical protein